MSAEKPRNLIPDPSQRKVLASAHDAAADHASEGSERSAAAFSEALDHAARSMGWDDPAARQAMATGHYRAPGFVVTDALGYDRELAKASVGAGWAALIDRVFDAKETRFPHMKIVQVKEKYASLTIYAEGIPGGTREEFDDFHDLLDEIARDSTRTCARCGAPGVVRAGGWYLTLCDADADGRPALPERP